MSSFNERRLRCETCPTSARIGIHYPRLWCLVDPFSARSFLVHGTSAAAARRWPAAAYTERGRCLPSKKLLHLALPITRASFCLSHSPLSLPRLPSFVSLQFFHRYPLNNQVQLNSPNYGFEAVEYVLIIY